MAEETAKTNENNEAEIKLAQALEEIELLKKKNREIIEEKQQYANIEKKLEVLPKGESVEQLLKFKQQIEQERLEEKGAYTEALNKREQQFKEAIESKDIEINQLKNEIKDLKLISPAVSALTEIVHDPDFALSKLDREKIQVTDDRSVVYMSDDGFTTKPIQEVVKEKIPSWALKNQQPVGSGAPVGKTENVTSIAGIDANLLKRLANGEDLAAHEIHAKYGRDAWLQAKQVAKDYK